MTAVGAESLRDGARLERVFNGFSGCRVGLYRAGRRVFVRKQSGSPAYNDRLEGQAQAQGALAGLADAPFRVPQILSTGMRDGLFYFDSEFVCSEDMIGHLARTDRHGVDKALDRLAAIIGYFAGRRRVGPDSVLDHVSRKLDALGRDLDECCRTEVRHARMCAEWLRTVDRHESSLSHEDLTLENVLVDAAGDVWLIDCLDSPHPHYWFSCAKMFQDLEGGWFSLHAPGRDLDPATRLYATQRLSGLVHDIDPDYRRVHYLLLCLSFLRIMPYARAHAPELGTALRERMREYLLLIG